jgi:hypothetical protein
MYLCSFDRKVLSAALEILDHAGSQASEHLPFLFRCLERHEMSSIAFKILCKTCVAIPAAPNAAAYLYDVNRDCRHNALKVLYASGVAAVPHAAAISSCLDDGDFVIRGLTLRTMGRLGEASLPYASKMCRCLEDQFWSIRLDAARALGMLGRDVCDVAVEPLARAAECDEHALVREAAAEARGVIERPMRIVVLHPGNSQSNGNVNIAITTIAGDSVASICINVNCTGLDLKQMVAAYFLETVIDLRLITSSADIIEDEHALVDLLGAL